jgi:hypothetical protein
MDSETKDEIHIILTVPIPVTDLVVSNITEHLQEVHSDTTLTSINQSQGRLFFHCPSSDPDIRDKFGHLFIQWLDTGAVPITNFNMILGRL